MRFGVVFSQTEIGADPVVIRDFVQAVEALGYHHILLYDHVLGAHPDRFGPLGITPPYTHVSQFHEPFVLFGYLGAVTAKLEFATGILILPQRQTALVAKQAAEVDVLTGGRLRLGVGIGWNPVEYEALGQDFHTRGQRIEEQVALLRQLWTKELVDFNGKYHTVQRAGLNPLPIQRPIPIWMGGMAGPALKRIARTADGWIPEIRPGPEAAEVVARMREYIRAAGRRVEDVGLEGRIRLSRTPRDQWGRALEEWLQLGATHVSIDTMRWSLRSPQEHLDAIRQFKEEAGG